RNFVGPLVDQLRANRQFQRLARWSPDHLARGAKTSQRQRLETVDRELVTCARRTAEAAGQASAAAWIASRPWFDLVSPEEYFQPHQGLHLLTSEPVHSAEFWKRNALATPLGDYVCRGLFARLAYFTQTLNGEWWACFHALQAQGTQYDVADRLFSAK